MKFSKPNEARRDGAPKKKAFTKMGKNKFKSFELYGTNTFMVEPPKMLYNAISFLHS
jgi:hypothetical protein